MKRILTLLILITPSLLKAQSGNPLLDNFELIFILIFVFVFSSGIYGIYSYKKRQAHFRKMNYEKYITENPQCLINGRISCRHCGGTQIQVRNLMNRTFFREHLCAQCGKTLYYSPESSL